MSEIATLVFTLLRSFVTTFFVCLAAILVVMLIDKRDFDKSTTKNRRAARRQSQKEARAQAKELYKSTIEFNKSKEEFDKAAIKFDKSLDRMNESMDRTIEFKRLMRDYSNYKIKMIEARENFREPEFSDEKNIH